MIEFITTTLILFFLGYYLVFLWNVRWGLKAATKPLSFTRPLISVVIAARDEEKNIQQCVRALAQQEYDPQRYEIIIVDDHSHDRTVDLASGLAARYSSPKITVLSLKDHRDRYGKPAAIAHGVENSTGEIILCTDADCVVSPRWMNSMARCLEPSVAFVAGPVLERPSGTTLSGLQSLEFLGLITTAAGLIGSGKPIICNGANIGYRKSAFAQVSGYGDSASSCDDETLMQRMVKREIGRAVFNADADATVVTSTPETISEFWRQRTRWASKRGRYEDKTILARLLGLYGFFLILFLSSVVTLFESSLCFPLLGVILVKGAAEFTVLTAGARLFQQRFHPGHFLIAELFHVPYIVFAALIGQFSSLRWKDRRLDQ